MKIEGPSPETKKSLWRGGATVGIAVLAVLAIINEDKLSNSVSDEYTPKPTEPSPSDEILPPPTAPIELPQHLHQLTTFEELQEMLTKSALNAATTPDLPAHVLPNPLKNDKQTQEVASTEAAPTPLPTENAPAEAEPVEESEPESIPINEGEIVPLVMPIENESEEPNLKEARPALPISLPDIINVGAGGTITIGALGSLLALVFHHRSRKKAETAERRRIQIWRFRQAQNPPISPPNGHGLHRSAGDMQKVHDAKVRRFNAILNSPSVNIKPAKKPKKRPTGTQRGEAARNNSSYKYLQEHEERQEKRNQSAEEQITQSGLSYLVADFFRRVLYLTVNPKTRTRERESTEHISLNSRY